MNKCLSHAPTSMDAHHEGTLQTKAAQENLLKSMTKKITMWLCNTYIGYHYHKKRRKDKLEKTNLGIKQNINIKSFIKSKITYKSEEKNNLPKFMVKEVSVQNRNLKQNK